MVKYLMAQGISRNEANAIASAARKLNIRNKALIYPLAIRNEHPPVIRSKNYKIQKVTERYLWEPYEFSVIGEEQAMRYAEEKMGRKLIEYLLKKDLVRKEVRGTDSGYIEMRMSILVAETEDSYELAEM